MYRFTLLFLFTFFQLLIYGQKVTYTIPSSLVNEISKDDYKKIIDITFPIVQKRFKIESIGEGVILLSKNQGIQAFNLDNLILKCVNVKDKSLWKEVINDHFAQIFSSIDEKKKIDFQNFESIKKYLSIRIYPKEEVLKRGDISKMVLKSDLEDTYTLLMLDLPSAFTNVEKEMFDLWKHDKIEVFKIAQKNVNKQQVEKITQKIKVDGSEIEMSFIGEENYAASYALDLLTNSPELIGQWGSVVAIPNKGLVNICKVSKEKPVDFVKFIQKTKPMIEKYFAQHPQPISDQYFWYFKGKFTKINVIKDVSGNVNVIAPFGLTQLMTQKN